MSPCRACPPCLSSDGLRRSVSGSLTCSLGAAHVLCVSFTRVFCLRYCTFHVQGPFGSFFMSLCRSRFSYLSVCNRSLRAPGAGHVTVSEGQGPGSAVAGLLAPGLPEGARGLRPGRTAEEAHRSCPHTHAALGRKPHWLARHVALSGGHSTVLLLRQPASPPAGDAAVISVACEGTYCCCHRGVGGWGA